MPELLSNLPPGTSAAFWLCSSLAVLSLIFVAIDIARGQIPIMKTVALFASLCFVVGILSHSVSYAGG